VDGHAPDTGVVAIGQLQGRVVGVSGLQPPAAPVALQVFEGEGAVEHGHHHQAGAGFDRPVHHQQVAVEDAGILDGDLLVVDRAIEPRAGLVVVAVLDGAFTLKHLKRHRGRWRLEAAHPDYPPLELADCDDARIWGVAIHAIHSL